VKYEIKREFIETGKKYDDSHGQDIPIGYIKQWIEIESLKDLIGELEWVYKEDRQFLPTPRLEAMERILKELKRITKPNKLK